MDLDSRDEQYWYAVLQRTPDARFVYAVRSTGIYCRSTCPARRPQREQVVFLLRRKRQRRQAFGRVGGVSPILPSRLIRSCHW